MKRAIIALFILCLGLACWAATMDGFYVQGNLTDRDVPVNSETCKVWVGIIDDATGVIAAENMYSNIKVTNGVFNLLINFPAARDLDWSKPYRMRFAFSPTGSGSLYSVLPEQKLVSVPYAFMAKRIYEGMVEATILTAKRGGSGILPEARMAYQSSVTDEAVAAWIGTSAVGKLGVEDKKPSVTYYYGAFAQGRDYGTYAESTGQAVYAASTASIESLGSALIADSVIVGARINGPLKVARKFSIGMIGMTPSESIPGASEIITMPSGAVSTIVRNSLVKAASTLVYFQLISNTAAHPRVWVTNLTDGRFTLNRSPSTGEMKIGYLLVN